MYEIIDESLKLASCGINDLTFEQAQHFLFQWEDGAKLGSLILFFDPETSYLVMNKDNPNYEFNLEMGKAYLCAEGEGRDKCRKIYGLKYREVFQTIDNFERHTRFKIDIDMIGHQRLDEVIGDPVIRSVLEALGGKDCNSRFLMSEACMYGVMNGKRMERAKRKVVLA